MACTIVYFVLEYKSRQKKNEVEKLIREQQFRNELITTQVEIEEETRKNLASDLHDNIGQLLSLTNVTLASINTKDIKKTEQKVGDAQKLVEHSIKELRQLSKIIYGEQLIAQGLVEAIQHDINWLQRNGYYTVEFIHVADIVVDSNPDKDMLIYRLLQECINNIVKHATADAITVTLDYANSRIELTITDNGTGFIPDQVSNGLGLQNMRRRIALLNGVMTIDSVPHKGTSIHFNIPYP